MKVTEKAESFCAKLWLHVNAGYVGMQVRYLLTLRLGRLITQDHSERTVGTALRGRPLIEFYKGAATEGRPYSTFRGASLIARY